jgi:Polyketide cyclase / dehydrase and lipid transport
MPKASAQRDLLASRSDVWSFVSEPHNFPDWWPGVAAVRPDRRGFAEGARWEVVGPLRPTFLRQAASSGILQVRAIEPLERFAFYLSGDHLMGELRLRAVAEDRTRAILTVDGAFMWGMSRSLPRRALNRLHSLCQTAEELGP